MLKLGELGKRLKKANNQTGEFGEFSEFPPYPHEKLAILIKTSKKKEKIRILLNHVYGRLQTH